MTFGWRKFAILANLLQPSPFVWSTTFMSLFQTCWDTLYISTYFVIVNFTCISNKRLLDKKALLRRRWFDEPNTQWVHALLSQPLVQTHKLWLSSLYWVCRWYYGFSKGWPGAYPHSRRLKGYKALPRLPAQGGWGLYTKSGLIVDSGPHNSQPLK